MKMALGTRFALVMIPVVALMTGGGGEIDLDAMNGEEGVEVAQTANPACLGSYSAEVTEARRLIGLNCGTINSCGSLESTTHSDIFLSSTSTMCSCYTYMWNNRNSYPWTALQVIYHPPASCGVPHIHLKNQTTCGTMHFDLDDSAYEASVCTNTDSGSAIDKTFCNSGSLKSSCSGGGGGWNCANSAYNGVQYWTCNGNNRTKCVNGVPTTSTCGWGCYSMPAGKDDLCINTTTGWNCANSAYGSSQLWTCSGGSLYKCSGSTQLKVTCPSGCNVMPLGTNDTCK